MSEWLSYSLAGDGAPALVDFDASLDDQTYRSAHRYCTELTVEGFETDGEALPTDDAGSKLYTIEQNLEAALGSGGGALALTIASAGTFRYVLYCAQDIGSELVSIARASGLTARYATNADGAWALYDRWALHGEDLEVARDRVQLDELAEFGLDMSTKREITFDFEFDDAEKAEAGDNALAGAGYGLPSEFDDLGDEFVRVALVIVPTAENVAEVRRAMTAVVERYGGRYIGWGCEPQLEATP